MPSDLETHMRAIRAGLAHSAGSGFLPTALPGVRMFWADGTFPRMPLNYDPGIAVIVSGRKIGYLDDRRIEYGPGQYLAVGLPLVFECETLASPDAPMTGLFLDAEPQALQDLARDIEALSERTLPASAGLGIEPLTLPDPMLDAVTRLARQLTDPAEAALLGPATLREVFFHALQDRHGCVLLAQTRTTRPEARIARILRKLETGPDGFKSVEKLARQAGMSPASLHRHFKATTGLAPLQYLKRQRLMRAKSLLVYGDLGVAETAHRVGYASQAQFSRDFSRFFGMPPSRASEVASPAA